MLLSIFYQPEHYTPPISAHNRADHHIWFTPTTKPVWCNFIPANSGNLQLIDHWWFCLICSGKYTEKAFVYQNYVCPKIPQYTLPYLTRAGGLIVSVDLNGVQKENWVERSHTDIAKQSGRQPPVLESRGCTEVTPIEGAIYQYAQSYRL